MTKIDLYKGDCLQIMDELIAGGVIVDAIICDPPYGTTACKWDTVIPFEEMWLRLNRLIKPNGAIVLFGSEPFSSLLRVSNLKMFKYDWVWDKNRGNGHLIAKKRPLQRTEYISVFSQGTMTNGSSRNMPYFPQMEKLDKTRKFYKNKEGHQSILHNKHSYREDYTREDYKHKYPTNLINFSNSHRTGQHPTQKPVELMKYLIKTYTNENELVLDFTMGSGSTGVACKNTNRSFIGVEMDDKYFEIAKKRIEDTKEGLFDE